MTKRNLFRKVALAGTTVVFLLSILNSCSKDEEKDNKGTTFKIDLADQTYLSLTYTGGTAVISSLGIIVACQTNNPPRYFAAAVTCPNCTSSINYVNSYSDPAYWRCSNCKSSFDGYGSVVGGPSIMNLKVYSSSRSGNIITISVTK